MQEIIDRLDDIKKQLNEIERNIANLKVEIIKRCR